MKKFSSTQIQLFIVIAITAIVFGAYYILFPSNTSDNSKFVNISDDIESNDNEYFDKLTSASFGNTTIYYPESYMYLNNKEEQGAFYDTFYVGDIESSPKIDYFVVDYPKGQLPDSMNVNDSYCESQAKSDIYEEIELGNDYQLISYSFIEPNKCLSLISQVGSGKLIESKKEFNIKDGKIHGEFRITVTYDTGFEIERKNILKQSLFNSTHIFN